MDSYRSFLSGWIALISAGTSKIEHLVDLLERVDRAIDNVGEATGVPVVATRTFAMDVSDEDAALELEVARAMKAPLSTFDASQLRRRWLNLQNRPVLAAIFKAAMLALASKNPALAEVINGILATVPQKQ